MFGKKKKNEEQFDEEEYQDVDDAEGLNTGDEDDDDEFDENLFEEVEDDANSKSLKQKYSKLSRMFHKHLIYVRIVTLVSLTFVLGVSLTGGIMSGLHTQGAKARQVTGYGTTLQFSKTGASITIGQAYRSGDNVLIPVYNDGTVPIDTSQKASGSGGSFSGVTSTLTLPSYDGNSSSNSSSFIPISAKNYRMFISALKGKLNPETQARYVKFGATGVGAIVLSNVQSDATVRVMIENKKIYKVPGAESPGLTVNGKPVDTKRDVVLINTNLAATKPSQRKFDVTSDAKDLLKVAYADDYMAVWKSDKSVMNKLEKVDKQKLLELESNKDSLNASSDASSDAATSSSDGVDTSSDSDNALTAQKTIVKADEDSQNELDGSKSALQDYVKRVSSQMTMSSDYKIVTN